MYDPQTEVVAACFDPNNMQDSTNITSTTIEQNNNNNNSSSFQQLDHTNNPQELDYQNPNNNWTTHEMMTYPTDLLTLLHLQPQQPNNNVPVYDPISAATLPYDPMFHLNLPPQPSPLLRDLMFQSLPHGYTTTTTTTSNNGNNGNCSLFGQIMEDGEGSHNNMINGLYQDGEQQQQQHIMSHNNGMFEFSGGVNSLDDGNLGKAPKNFVTERQRRQNFNSKYEALRGLIPTPTKMDRASIVQDAIAYINELKRTVSELKLLVDKKRISKERTKRLKTEDNTNPSENGGEPSNGHGLEGSCLVKPDPDEAFVGTSATQLRSSWLQRKCKDTEVDVRIVDDEVTIKLVQRKKMNCLLSVSRTLDDLQLDLRHVAGGHVGDYYSYLFNSKICEGSSVYASAIANKLIEVVERQYAAASVVVAPSTSF